MSFDATVTSAFGRRKVTRAQLEAQFAVNAARAACAQGGDEALAPGRRDAATAGAVHKWSLLRTLSEIRDGLGVSDRALGVLSALLSFHPETALTLDDDGLIVFPSNRALSLRANGMSEATLRRHLSGLVEAGLIIRRDSPNGKRFARYRGHGAGWSGRGSLTQSRERGAGDELGADGSEAAGTGRGLEIVQAFGFDLSPLVVRAAEFDSRLEAARDEQRRARLLKERINLLRRDLTKRLAFALDEGLSGPWERLRRVFLDLCTPLRRLRGLGETAELSLALERLQDEVAAALKAELAAPRAAWTVAASASDVPDHPMRKAEIQNSTGYAAHSGRRIQESNPHQIHEIEPASEDAGAQNPSLHTVHAPSASIPATPSVEASPPNLSAEIFRQLPLALVLDACPDIADFDLSGTGIDNWSALLAVAESVRPMLGVSPDAWREAVRALGQAGAACALAFILQRCEHSSDAVRSKAPDGRLVVTVHDAPAIRSPGGYLRALAQKGARDPFFLRGVLLGHLTQRNRYRQRQTNGAAAP